MAEESNAPPNESAHVEAAGPKAEIDDEREGLLAGGTGAGTLKVIMQNVQAACRRARRREAGDSDHADPPVLTNTPALTASTAGSASAELETALAASTVSVGDMGLMSTDTWWAQRWIDKATPGEIAAMRGLLL